MSQCFLVSLTTAQQQTEAVYQQKEKKSLIYKSWIPRHLFTDLLISYFLLINLCLISLYLSDLSALSFSLTQTFDQKYIGRFLRDLVVVTTLAIPVEIQRSGWEELERE